MLVSDMEEFIAAGCRLLHAGGGRLWLVDQARGQVLEAPEEAGPILQVADRFRTLGEHRRALLEAGWQDDGSGSIDALLAGLARSGALLARSDLLRRILEAPPEPPPPPISAIAWVTRDRPTLLRRSVESAIANLRLYGRQVELKVYDDSADAKARQATRDMLAEVSRREGLAVYYAGAEEKQEFAAALQARADGVAAEIIEFALFDPLALGYTPGANTNAVLLDSCGQLIVQADDDTVFRFASLPEAAAELRLSSAADPTEVRFLEAAVELRDVDILAAHQALLGQAVGDCLRRNLAVADFGPVSPELLPRLDSSVAVTMAGVCGDSGLGSAQFVLWLGGASRQLAWQSERHYREALRRREILRAADRPTLGSSPFLMGMHLGLDNRLALPPFLPGLRNSDGLFGLMLKCCRPSGLTGYLPLAIVHLPDEKRSSSGVPLWQGRTRAADLLAALIGHALRTGTCPGLEQECRSLGEQMAGIAALPARGFQALARQAWAESLSGNLLALEEILEQQGGRPDYWAKDARAWIRAAQEAVAAPGPLIPEDLPGEDSADDAAARWQQLVLCFGKLLRQWPAIREAAGELAREGRRLARPL
jgi:hypothetical protein